MTDQSRFMAFSLVLFALIAGVGGFFGIILFGAKISAPGATPMVIVISGQEQNAESSAPTEPPSSEMAATPIPYIVITFAWELEPTSTFVPRATASEALPATPVASSTPEPTETAIPATATDPRLPLAGASPTPIVIPRPNGLPDTYLPTVSARAREIYRYGLSIGNNPRAFTRLGDCHSSYPGFLGAFDSPSSYRLGEYTYLQDVIAYYAGSFSHNSLSAYSGFHMGSYFSEIWADPKYCRNDENPMECEYRLSHPSVIFINVGTLNKDSPDEQYESFVRPIIEFWIARGVVPILNTKADNIEGEWRFNAVVRRLAAEYDVPLWDYWIASQSLPNQGLAEDMVHLSDGLPYFDDLKQMQSGWTMRNLTALQALDTVWRGVR